MNRQLMTRREVSLAALTGLGGAFVLASPTTSQAKEEGATVRRITGLFNGGTFEGTYDLRSVAPNISDDGLTLNGLSAVGILKGKLVNDQGRKQKVEQIVVWPLTGISSDTQQGQAVAQATCPILHLVLGPLDLNLLGLVVHLDRVVLDITAQSGPGNLLGNLLCAIANLLNGGLSLNQLLMQLILLLNQILAAIG